MAHDNHHIGILRGSKTIELALRPTDEIHPAVDQAPKLQRAHGRLCASFKSRNERTVIDTLYQAGCLKTRVPRLANGPLEAVMINTAGGLTDGDQLDIHITWQAGTKAVIPTQACERIYRSRAHPARISAQLGVDNNATALWLPQETIVFDGAQLERNFSLSLEPNAQAFACEAVILGRPAMGEEVLCAHLRDDWRIEKAGRLIFADRLLLTGNPSAKLDQMAMGNGARAFASVIICTRDIPAQRDKIRPILDDLPAFAGCSDLGEVLLVRMLAENGQSLRSALIRLFNLFKDDFALPRVWQL